MAPPNPETPTPGRRKVQDTIAALQPEAEGHWATSEPKMAALSRVHPLEPSDYIEPDPFRALVVSFANQQVSVQAGAAVMRRVDAACPDLSPAAVLSLGPDGLRSCGMSRQKSRYVLDLASRCLDGELDWDRMRAAPDGDVLRELCAVKGIGPWTAKMFLMFHLHRPDVSAPEDLGLRHAVAMFYDVAEAQAWKRMETLAPAWSPYNTVAARVLWKARRGED